MKYICWKVFWRCLRLCSAYHQHFLHIGRYFHSCQQKACFRKYLKISCSSSPKASQCTAVGPPQSFPNGEWEWGIPILHSFVRSGTHPILSGMGRSHSPLLVEAKHKLDGGDAKKRRLCGVKLVTERIDYKYSMRTTCWGDCGGEKRRFCLFVWQSFSDTFSVFPVFWSLSNFLAARLKIQDSSWFLWIWYPAWQAIISIIRLRWQPSSSWRPRRQRSEAKEVLVRLNSKDPIKNWEIPDFPPSSSDWSWISSIIIIVLVANKFAVKHFEFFMNMNVFKTMTNQYVLGEVNDNHRTNQGQ